MIGRGLLLVLLPWTVALGCTGRPPAKTSPVPEPAPPPVSAPATVPCPPAEPPPPAPDARPPELQKGDAAYDRGDLAAAATAYDAYLAHAGSGPDVPRVLARLVALCSLPPTRDPLAARQYRDRLVSEFPESAHRGEADLLLRSGTELEAQRKRVQELEKEVARLTQLVEKLKEIDLKKPPG